MTVNQLEWVSFKISNHLGTWEKQEQWRPWWGKQRGYQAGCAPCHYNSKNKGTHTHISINQSSKKSTRQLVLFCVYTWSCLGQPVHILGPAWVLLGSTCAYTWSCLGPALFSTLEFCAYTWSFLGQPVHNYYFWNRINNYFCIFVVIEFMICWDK